MLPEFLVDALCYFDIILNDDNSTKVWAVPAEFRRAANYLVDSCVKESENGPGKFGGMINGLGKRLLWHWHMKESFLLTRAACHLIQVQESISVS